MRARRRGVLPAVVCLASVLALLAGCTPAPTLVEGSTVTVAVDEPPTSLNAATTAARTGVNADIAYLTGSAFAYRDADGELVDDRSLGTATLVSEDPFTVRYTVSDGVVWSDGAPLDADDLLLAWVAGSGVRNDADLDPARYVDRATGRFTDAFPDDAVYFDGPVGGGLERSESVPALGDDGRSLTVRLDGPVHDWRTLLAPGVPAHVVAAGALDLPLDGEDDVAAAKERLREAVLDDERDDLAALSQYWNDAFSLDLGAAEPGAAESDDAEPDAAEPGAAESRTAEPDAAELDARLRVASGPYRVAELADDGTVTLRANGRYRGDRRPTFETLVLRPVADPREAVRLLEAGEIDVASPTPTAELLVALREADGLEVVTSALAAYEHLDLQIEGSRSGAFADRRVREAFLLTVPRARILEELVLPLDPDAELLQSFTLQPGAPGTPAAAAYEESVADNGSERYAEPDLERARELLDEAGVSDVPVCILYDPGNPRRLAQYELIADSAARAGFVVSSCAAGDWAGRLGSRGAYDAALFAWDTSRVGPAAVGDVFRSGSSRSNHTGFADEVADELLDRLESELDPAAQRELLAEVDQRIWRAAYGLPLYRFPALTVTGPRVEGVTRSPLERGVFWDAWAWRPAGGAESAPNG